MDTTADAVTHPGPAAGNGGWPPRPIRPRWLDLPVLRKGLLVIALPVSALVVVVAMSLVLLIDERHARAEGTRSKNFSSASATALSLAVNGESGVRGSPPAR